MSNEGFTVNVREEAGTDSNVHLVDKERRAVKSNRLMSSVFVAARDDELVDVVKRFLVSVGVSVTVWDGELIVTRSLVTVTTITPIGGRHWVWLG